MVPSQINLWKYLPNFLPVGLVHKSESDYFFFLLSFRRSSIILYGKKVTQNSDCVQYSVSDSVQFSNRRDSTCSWLELDWFLGRPWKYSVGVLSSCSVREYFFSSPNHLIVEHRYNSQGWMLSIHKYRIEVTAELKYMCMYSTFVLY